MQNERGAIRHALLRSDGRRKDGAINWVPRDEVLVVRMILECGTFNATPIRDTGWQCSLQLYSQWPYVTDFVWQRVAPRIPGVYWTTIASATRLRAPDANNSPQYLRGLRLCTKGSTRAFAAFLREQRPPWRESVWREWADATDLYGRGITASARRMAVMRLKYAIERDPPTRLLDWLESNNIIKPE